MAREMLSYILTAEGFSVLTAEDGLQALGLLDVSPDLIITDINMPNLDGIELIKQLRQQIQLNDVPIIVMSALDSGAVQDAINAGATGAACKPMHLTFLLTLIAELLCKAC